MKNYVPYDINSEQKSVSYGFRKKSIYVRSDNLRNSLIEMNQLLRNQCATRKHITLETCNDNYFYHLVQEMYTEMWPKRHMTGRTCTAQQCHRSLWLRRTFWWRTYLESRGYHDLIRMSENTTLQRGSERHKYDAGINSCLSWEHNYSVHPVNYIYYTAALFKVKNSRSHMTETTDCVSGTYES